MLRFMNLILCVGAASTLATAQGQEAKPPASATSAEKPTFPAVLPGKGLAQHDFFRSDPVCRRRVYARYRPGTGSQTAGLGNFGGEAHLPGRPTRQGPGTARFLLRWGGQVARY